MHSACAMKAHIMHETRGRPRPCVRTPCFRGFIFREWFKTVSGKV